MLTTNVDFFFLWCLRCTLAPAGQNILLSHISLNVPALHRVIWTVCFQSRICWMWKALTLSILNLTLMSKQKTGMALIRVYSGSRKTKISSLCFFPSNSVLSVESSVLFKHGLWHSVLLFSLSKVPVQGCGHYYNAGVMLKSFHLLLLARPLFQRSQLQKKEAVCWWFETSWLSERPLLAQWVFVCVFIPYSGTLLKE